MNLSLLQYNMIGIDVRIEHTDIGEDTKTESILIQKYFLYETKICRRNESNKHIQALVFLWLKRLLIG